MCHLDEDCGLLKLTRSCGKCDHRPQLQVSTYPPSHRSLVMVLLLMFVLISFRFAAAVVLRYKQLSVTSLNTDNSYQDDKLMYYTNYRKITRPTHQ